MLAGLISGAILVVLYLIFKKGSQVLPDGVKTFLKVVLAAGLIGLILFIVYAQFQSKMGMH